MLLCKKTNIWLRIAYSFEYNTPVTFLKFVDCEFDPLDSNYLVI